MNRQENKTVGRCPERALGKVVIAIAVVAFSWLSACPEEAQAQRLRKTRAGVGPVAEKPPSPISGSAPNAPMILSVTNTANRSVTIRFQDFAAKVSRKTFVVDRQTVGSPMWRQVYSNRINDHRFPFDPHVRDHRRKPGAEYVHRDTQGLIAGKKYRYRVRATIPYSPHPSVLLSAARTITVNPPVIPTPPTTPPTLPPTQPPTQPPPPPPPTPPPPTDVTKTVYLKARPIGQLLRPYVAISLIPGHITQIEIPEVNGQTLQVSFVKRGYKMTETLKNPNATVMLTSGQTSTPSQITELFGTAQKKLHVKFVAFVTASQGQRPNSVAIKVSYTKTN